MKANEAPTKLYVNTNDHLTRNGFYAFTENNRKDSVEYTRTDAFMKKALAYLNDKFYFNNVFYGIVSTDFNAMEEMYDDFRKYMKGE